MEGRVVIYHRVSTDRQGKPGLGLDAQKATVMNYLNGGAWEKVGEYTEVESGGKNDRPELDKASRDCRLKSATLIASKLDRLNRDLGFITAPQKAAGKFVVAEMPGATEFTIHIFAAMAQHERKLISQRTKDALAPWKGNGRRGNPCLRRGERIPGGGAPANANAARIESADAFALEIAPIIQEMDGGSLRKIAVGLNNAGYRTARGKEWRGTSVKRILDKLKAQSNAEKTPERESPEMKMIVMGNHPKARNDSHPKVYNCIDARRKVADFNKMQREGRLRAELVEIAYSQESYAVAVIETTSGRVWEYI